MLGQALFQPGHFQFAGGIVQRVILAGAPLEECPHRNQVRELAAEGERLAILLAVVIQMALIPLQQRLGHFRRLRDAALDAPDGESLQVVLAVLNRALGVILHSHPLEEGGGERGEAVRVAWIADCFGRLSLSFFGHGS